MAAAAAKVSGEEASGLLASAAVSPAGAAASSAGASAAVAEKNAVTVTSVESRLCKLVWRASGLSARILAALNCLLYCLWALRERAVCLPIRR